MVISPLAYFINSFLGNESKNMCILYLYLYFSYTVLYLYFSYIILYTHDLHFSIVHYTKLLFF